METIHQPRTLLTRHEVAAMLGVHVGTIDRMCRDGRLEALRLTPTIGGGNSAARYSGTVRITLVSVARMLDTAERVPVEKSTS